MELNFLLIEDYLGFSAHQKDGKYIDEHLFSLTN